MSMEHCLHSYIPVQACFLLSCCFLTQETLLHVRSLTVGEVQKQTERCPEIHVQCVHKYMYSVVIYHMHLHILNSYRAGKVEYLWTSINPVSLRSFQIQNNFPT